MSESPHDRPTRKIRTTAAPPTHPVIDALRLDRAMIRSGQDVRVTVCGERLTLGAVTVRCSSRGYTVEAVSEKIDHRGDLNVVLRLLRSIPDAEPMCRLRVTAPGSSAMVAVRVTP